MKDSRHGIHGAAELASWTNEKGQHQVIGAEVGFANQLAQGRGRPQTPWPILGKLSNRNRIHGGSVKAASREQSQNAQGIPALQPGPNGYTAAMFKRRVMLLLLALGMIFGVGIFLGVFLPRVLGLTSRTRTYNTATLLRQVQTLSQLVTVEYVMEKVVVAEDVKWFGENRVLMVAHGIVKAGIDLSRLEPGDLRVSDKTIVIKLPPPQITDTYLDDKQTRIIERTTGLLRAFDKDLEQSVRQNAVADISRAARNGGILKDAETRAHAQLTNLFRQLGYEKVEFR